MLSEDEEVVFHLLKGNMKLSRVQIEEACHFSKHKTMWILNELIEKNMVKKSGSTRNIKYTLQ